MINMSEHVFIRTTQPEHKIAVQHLWVALFRFTSLRVETPRGTWPHIQRETRREVLCHRRMFLQRIPNRRSPRLTWNTSKSLQGNRINGRMDFRRKLLFPTFRLSREIKRILSYISYFDCPKNVLL